MTLRFNQFGSVVKEVLKIEKQWSYWQAPSNPNYLWLKGALKVFRLRKSYKVESTTRIALPFAVQTHIEASFNLEGTQSSTCIVCVVLTSYVKQYMVTRDEIYFAICWVLKKFFASYALLKQIFRIIQKSELYRSLRVYLKKFVCFKYLFARTYFGIEDFSDANFFDITSHFLLRISEYR